MAILIIFLCFILLYLILFSSAGNSRLFESFRLAFIQAIIIFSCLFCLSTEVLSLFHLITGQSFILFWLFMLLLLGIIFYLRFNSIMQSLIQFKNRLVHIPYYKLILIFLVFFILPLLLMALLCPPNNWDSMTYHLPRIEHWINNRNVAPFPTNNVRQIYLAPMSEYILLHFRLLSGNDYFYQLIQFFAMLGAVCLSSLIAKQYGLKKKGQILAAILTFSIPMGILQSTSTQTDYLCGFYLISFVYFGYQFYRENKPHFSLDLFFLLCSFSLGVFTKATFYIFVLPFGLYYAIRYFVRFKWKTLLIIPLIILFFLIINFSFLYRNAVLFDSPLGPVKESVLYISNTNTHFSLSVTYSNMVKNIGSHLGLPIELYNFLIDKLIFGLHAVFGINLNPDLYWTGYKTQFNIHEDDSGNFIILILLIASVFYFLFRYKKYKSEKRDLLFYLLCLVTAFIIFSFLLRWQPWQTRLDLPLFIVFTPWIACIFCSGISHANQTVTIVHKKILLAGLIVFLIMAVVIFKEAFIKELRKGISAAPVQVKVYGIDHQDKIRIFKVLRNSQKRELIKRDQKSIPGGISFFLAPGGWLHFLRISFFNEDFNHFEKIDFTIGEKKISFSKHDIEKNWLLKRDKFNLIEYETGHKQLFYQKSKIPGQVFQTMINWPGEKAVFFPVFWRSVLISLAKTVFLLLFLILFYSVFFYRKQKIDLILIIMVILLIFSLPFIYFNSSKEVLGGDCFLLKRRQENYFNNRPDLYAHYMELKELLQAKDRLNIGLNLHGDSWEYLFWALLSRNEEHKKRLIDLRCISYHEIYQKTDNVPADFKYDLIFSNYDDTILWVDQKNVHFYHILDELRVISLDKESDSHFIKKDYF